MTLRRTSARIAQLAGPLLGSLLMAGCGAEKGTAPSLAPCPDPDLRPARVERIEGIVPADYPAPFPLERLPAITRLFPASPSETPLPLTSLPRSIIRDVRPIRQAQRHSGPNLVGPDSEASAGASGPTLAAPESIGGRLPAVEPVGETPDEETPPAGREATQELRPTPDRLTDRPREMDAVARQAQAHVRRGYALAARGALYSARAEFVLALRVITQALDLQSGNREHSQALAAGLGALEEADDFIPLGSRLEADLDIGILISGHRTPVLKDSADTQLLPLVALQSYYTYAQEQLGRAAGHEEAGSMALYGLGKIYSTMAADKIPNVVAPEPKAMVFHQAALEAHAGNFMAANELAVLSARYGRYETARELLRHGVKVAPHSAMWQNLAVVHRQLGETDLAMLAENEAALAVERENAAVKAGKLVPSSDVRWVDPDTFAATTKPNTDVQRPAAAPAGPGAPQPAVTPPAETEPTAKRSWWPLGARNQRQASPSPVRR